MYYVYLVLCKDNSIYTGITIDVAARFKKHQLGTASRYTRSRGVIKILYTEPVKNRSAALKREAEIKSWDRANKLKLISRP